MLIKEKIKSEILKTKKDMRLDVFLNNVLYKNDGYYLNKDPIGKKRDFITAPEISQTFGEIIGLYFLYFWKTKIKTQFNLIELGPGKGTLFNDISKSVSKHSYFLKNANIIFVEKNKELIKIQKQNSKKLFHNISWKQSFNIKSNSPSIIYSNEFFDCFPVRQFFLNKIWFEKYVGYNKKSNIFHFKDKIITDKKILALLSLYKKEKLLEVSFERNKYFEKICKYIKNNGGLFFTIDYGYLKNTNNFTLQALQNHKYSHVLENLGENDISSHVNFKELATIAKNYNLNIEEFCTQREFLIKYGILERKKILSDTSDSDKINNDVNRLINKNEMGDLFKCLIVSKL